ncbi:MAG: Gfo/Idh/MocA family oxidoreductase [Chthoniobacteraceae bacterium]
MNPPSNPTRRDFLKTSGALALASAIGLPGEVRAADLAKDKIKVGFVGCGGRGTGAANQTLQADSNVELWAMGDVFRDKIDSSLEILKRQFEDQPDKINVPDERKFDGLDAYQKVIDSGVDVVLLTTSPGFRPQHIKAAVEAGKHVFCEKPMATDPTGLRSVIESAKKAKEKNLALVDGFVWRWTKANQEAYKRIHAGDIGDILAIYSCYYTGASDRYPKWNRQNTKTDLEWQIRRWYYHTWLSGDFIVEQAIHSLDKMLWAMKDVPPARCVALGGRQTRPNTPPGEYGNIFDHFGVEFHWENGVKGYHFCRQEGNCYQANTDTIIGTKGTYEGESGSKRHTFVRTETPWRYKAPEGTKDDGYLTEHQEMYASIRSGQPINTGHRFTQTTLMAIMARMSAYTGKEVTWDRAMQSKEDLFPKNMTWDMKLPVAPVAMPGSTELI